MSNNLHNTSESITYITPKFLWFLILSYAMFLAISNWYDGMLIQLYYVNLSPGSLIFPFTFLLSDIITEVYGYKQTRKAIWSAFLFNLIFVIFGKVVTMLPHPAFDNASQTFDHLIKRNFSIVIASFLSYVLSEQTNAVLIARIKVALKGQLMAIRFVLSTIIASCFDSFIFVIIAFYGKIPLSKIGGFIINIWLIKTIIELLGLPISTRLAKYIKGEEQLDIYDTDTDFSLFSLQTHYNSTNNKYEKPKRSE